MQVILFVLAGVAVVVLSQLGLRSVVGHAERWHGIEVAGLLMITLGGYGLLPLAAAVGAERSRARRFAWYRRVGCWSLRIGVVGLFWEVLRPDIW